MEVIMALDDISLNKGKGRQARLYFYKILKFDFVDFLGRLALDSPERWPTSIIMHSRYTVDSNTNVFVQ